MMRLSVRVWLLVLMCVGCTVKKEKGAVGDFKDTDSNSTNDDGEVWDLPVGVEASLEETTPGHFKGLVQLLSSEEETPSWKGVYTAMYENGTAEVSLEHEESGEKLRVRVDTDTGVAFMEVGEFATRVDGYGVLDATEQFYMNAFGQSDMAKVVALMALEMGCMNADEVTSGKGFEGEDASVPDAAPPLDVDNPNAHSVLPPPQEVPGEDAEEPVLGEDQASLAAREKMLRVLNAAAVYPWQLLAKYATSFPATEAFMSRASCVYRVAEGVEEALPQPAQKASARWLVYESEDVVPYVPGYWPFDDEGAVTRSLTRGVAVGVCGAMCRGTCGPDCPANNCSTAYEWHCGEGAVRNLWRHKVCGSHAGCRAHDGCYDVCNSTHGCGTWGASTCRRGCDAQCLTDYCGWCAVSPVLCNSYTCNCISWMNGNGPYDMWDHYWWYLQNQSCDDSDACTADACSANACTHAPVSCNDNNGCTVDNCASATGCTYMAYTGCDDHNACTTDACSNGPDNSPVCGHTPLSCDDANPCTADSCDPVQGCVHSPVVCEDDGDVCNGAEVCDPATGSCGHPMPLLCNDANVCTTDTCDSTEGCVYTPVDCMGDGVMCNGMEVCNPATGLCDGLTLSPCDDLNACTTDSCDEVTGCTYQAVECTSDGDACNGVEMCNGATGTCHSFGAIVCDDANPCTSDACNSGSGVCEYTPVANNTSCVGQNTVGGDGNTNSVNNSIPPQ